MFSINPTQEISSLALGVFEGLNNLLKSDVIKGPLVSIENYVPMVLTL